MHSAVGAIWRGPLVASAFLGHRAATGPPYVHHSPNKLMNLWLDTQQAVEQTKQDKSSLAWRVCAFFKLAAALQQAHMHMYTEGILRGLRVQLISEQLSRDLHSCIMVSVL